MTMTLASKTVFGWVSCEILPIFSETKIEQSSYVPESATGWWVHSVGNFIITDELTPSLFRGVG